MVYKKKINKKKAIEKKIIRKYTDVFLQSFSLDHLYTYKTSNFVLCEFENYKAIQNDISIITHINNKIV